MPTLNARKTITVTDPVSGSSYPIAVTKNKSAVHAYRQTVSCPDGVQRRLVQIGQNPNYIKLVFFCASNVGDYDVLIAISSGGAEYQITLPPGRTFDLFNGNVWNNNSATDPDTIDEIKAEGFGGTSSVKFDALFDQ